MNYKIGNVVNLTNNGSASPMSLSFDVKNGEQMIGTCQMSIENIFLQLELVDDQGNQFSFQPNIENEKENFCQKNAINTIHSNVDEEINVKSENTNKRSENVLESQRSNANCLRPYEEIKIKFEDGFFDENTTQDTDVVENEVRMPTAENPRDSLSDEAVEQSLTDGNKGKFTTPQSEEYTVGNQSTTENREKSLKHESTRKRSKKSTKESKIQNTKNLLNMKCPKKDLQKKSQFKELKGPHTS